MEQGKPLGHLFLRTDRMESESPSFRLRMFITFLFPYLNHFTIRVQSRAQLGGHMNADSHTYDLM